MRSPPILPALHDIPHTLSPDNQVVNGNNTSFCEDLSKLEGFGYANKESLGGLLYAFFRRFAIEFDYDHHVISVRHGCYLTKESKDWHIQGKHYKLFCVEEPLDTSRNLGNSSDMASSKGLKQEFRRALDILFQKGSLYQCCEQWVFPPIFYSSNNFRNGDNSGYHHTHHAAGRRYALGYRNQNNYQYYNNNNNSNHTNSSVMNSSHHGYHESQTDVEENDENESKQQSRHDRSFAQFRSMATPVPFVPGSDGQYRTGRSNSAPRLDVPSQSGFRSGSNKNPPVPYSGLAGQSGGGGGSMSNKSSAHWSPPSKNGQASSFGGGSFLEQDPFAAPVPVKHSRNRSKSVSAVDHYNGIVACRPPVKHDKATASLASGVTTNANDTAALPVHSNNSRTGGQGSTGNHRPRRSKSSNRGGDGSKQGNSYSSDHTSNQQQRHAHGHTNGNNHTGGHTNGTGKQHGRSHTNNHNHNHNHGHGHGHTATNGNGQSLRAAVEFNLADIAPKAMLSSTASLVSKGTDASSGQSRPSDVKKGGHNRRHNVVWSTNSNRGDSRGTHSSVSPSSGHGNHHKGVQSASQDSLSDDS
ncbi:hypothetical protein BGZ94_008944 [Podila epigama]|nr:hypothetical protein BGZ94_008944 [Podila epigama]